VPPPHPTPFHRLSGPRAPQRLEAASGAPVLTVFAEAVGGAATVRAFGAEGMLGLEYAAALEGNVSAWLGWQATVRRAGNRRHHGGETPPPPHRRRRHPLPPARRSGG
jgi:hypothetical protein